MRQEVGGNMSKVYVHATLKIRIGRYEEFCVAMGREVPMLESHGWKMVGAWNTAVGRVYSVIHIWELPDANAFFEATQKWRAGPDFHLFRAVSREVIEEEVVTLVRKTPYSP
jgi:hypothetical protein